LPRFYRIEHFCFVGNLAFNLLKTNVKLTWLHVPLGTRDDGQEYDVTQTRVHANWAVGELVGLTKLTLAEYTLPPKEYSDEWVA
jgi:hypothetical protein